MYESRQELLAWGSVDYLRLRTGTTLVETEIVSCPRPLSRPASKTGFGLLMLFAYRSRWSFSSTSNCLTRCFRSTNQTEILSIFLLPMYYVSFLNPNLLSVTDAFLQEFCVV